MAKYSYKLRRAIQAFGGIIKITLPPPILLRCHSFIFSKHFYKITAIVKTTFHTYIGNGQPGAMKHLGCFFYAVHIDVVNGCLVCDGAKKAAKILWVHAGYACQFVQSNIGGVVKLDVFKNGFNQVDFVGVFGGILLADRIGAVL